MSQREVILLRGAWPLRLPATPRALLDLIALCHSPADLESVLGRVEWSGAGPSTIAYLVHGAVPAAPGTKAFATGYDPVRHLWEELHSPRFQRNVLAHVLAAFPEIRRDVFIHVPKCAGTDLVLNLAPRRVSIGRVMEEPDWLPAEEMLPALGEIVRTLAHAGDVFVYGHIPVHDYATRIGVRPGDRLFTVVRDPVDLIVSQANHTVSRLMMDPSGSAPDTRDFLSLLGISALPDATDLASLRQIAVRVLHVPEICQHNTICSYLGGFEAGTYEAAVNAIMAYDIEVTTSGRYNAWLHERFGIGATSRHNASQKFLGRREAIELFGEHLQQMAGEDQKLFDLISWALAARGKSSVTGREIADLIGDRPLHDIPGRIAAERRGSFTLRTLAPDGSADLIAVVGRHAVAAYLERHPALQQPSPPGTLVALDAKFGEGDKGGQYAQEGWSNPERAFCWTVGRKAVLRLPRPAQMADYTLQLIVRPFVWENRLPFQRVVMTVNGEKAGSSAVPEFAVLECSLPWSLIGPVDVITVELALPDAARPVDVNGVADDRELALCFERLLIFRTPTEAPLPLPVSSETSVARAEAPAPAAAESHQSLMVLFESLGENCEFGLVQRRCGAEPLGLLRFSSTPYAPLLRALRSRFAGMGRPESIEVEVAGSGREYMIFDKRFGFRYHAWVKLGEMTPADIHMREARRLPFLITKLIEDLTEGEKIFVFHGMKPLTEAEACELADAIRAYGPGTLLWVELADDAHPPGSVIPIAPGLLKGHMDRFAPGENAHDLSLGCWISLCRNARALVHAREAE